MSTGSIAILEPAPTPYRPAIFNEVAKRRDVTVYYYSSDKSNNRWSIDSINDEELFDERVLPSFRIGPFIIMPTLPYCLLRGGFEEVVGMSDNNLSLTMILAQITILLSDIQLTIWSEEIDTEYRYSRYKQQSLLKHLLAIAFWEITGIYQRVLYRVAYRVITYSELARDAALNKGASESKIVTRPQAIDPAMISTPDSNFAPPRGEPTILFLGTVGERKGIDVLIDAVDDFPDSAKVWIAGEGPARNSIVECTASDGQVEVFGRVDESSKTSLLRQADVLALPSRHEPWGIVVLEALVCGTPAVTTSAAGVAMVLDDSFVVDPGNPKQLAEAILSAVDTVPPNPPSVDEMAEPLYSTEKID